MVPSNDLKDTQEVIRNSLIEKNKQEERETT